VEIGPPIQGEGAQAGEDRERKKNTPTTKKIAGNSRRTGPVRGAVVGLGPFRERIQAKEWLKLVNIVFETML
jgi:hypothetical protein